MSKKRLTKVECRKSYQIILLFLVMSLLIFSLHIAGANYPSAPTSFTDNYTKNFSVSYPNGTMLNGTRGYIYNITINESQPTFKWVGYVGHIQGTYALQDASANALYDWTIANVTGEIYATKEGPQTSGVWFEQNTGAGSINPYNGGIPEWDNIICANSSQMHMESSMMNHSHMAEDRLNATFENNRFSIAEFYAGPTLVNNTISGGSTGCYGTYLRNITENTTKWRETLLTDNTYQNLSDAADTIRVYDIIYAAQINNDTSGFNGELYDFQIILPQSGLEGTVSNIAYYFYIELV